VNRVDVDCKQPQTAHVFNGLSQAGIHKAQVIFPADRDLDEASKVPPAPQLCGYAGRDKYIGLVGKAALQE
jgi:hypothetical protein